MAAAVFFAALCCYDASAVAKQPYCKNSFSVGDCSYFKDNSPHMPGLFGNRPADPSWGAALPLVFDVTRRHCGEHETMSFVGPVHDWADFLLRMKENGTVHYHYYGDWLQPGRIASEEMVSQMTSGFNALRAIKIASLAGTAKQQAYYRREFDQMLKSWEDRYWSEQNQTFLDGSQAPQVYALYLGVSSAAREKLALDRLLKLLQKDGLGTGIISTKYLFPVLSRYGHVHLALQLASSTSFPSWGYMISKGATTVWENWDAYHAPLGDTMSSHNHPAFTSVGAWFYTDLVGLRVDRSPLELGTMLERYDPLLPAASGELKTSQGLAEVEWRMGEFGTSVKGKCPSACIVRLPLNNLALSGALNQLLRHGHAGEVCGKAVCVHVGSGSFHFELSQKESSAAPPAHSFPAPIFS